MPGTGAAAQFKTLDRELALLALEILLADVNPVGGRPSGFPRFSTHVAAALLSVQKVAHCCCVE